jgi:hypothetical protein
MICKTDRIEREFRELSAGGNGWSPLLLAPILFAAAIIEQYMEPELTDLFRSPAEQVELCRKIGRKPYRSTHEFKRAGDLRSRGLTAVERADVVNRTNAAFEYGGRFKVCNWHVGTAEHFHLQVPRGAIWKGQ